MATGGAPRLSAPRVHPGRDGQVAHAVPPRDGHGARHRGNERAQCRAPPLAPAGGDADPGRPARPADRRPDRPPAAAARGGVAGRGAGGAATAADAARLGQRGWAQESGAGRLVARPRRRAALYAARGVLAQQGRVGPAHPGDACVERAASRTQPGDHRLDRGYRARLEPHSHPFHVGRQAA